MTLEHLGSVILGVIPGVQISGAVLGRMWAGSEIVFHLPQGRSSSPTLSWPSLGGSHSSTWSSRWASTTEMDAFQYGGKSARFSKVTERLGWVGRFSTEVVLSIVDGSWGPSSARSYALGNPGR